MIKDKNGENLMDNTKSEYNLKVTCPIDCGNAPKKDLLKNLNVAFAKNDIDFILKNLSDDACWNIIGNSSIQGKEAITEFLEQMQNRTVTEIHIRNIITHGSTAAVNGNVIVEDKKIFAYCTVYNFSSAGKNGKIKEITSYVIEVQTQVND